MENTGFSAMAQLMVETTNGRRTTVQETPANKQVKDAPPAPLTKERYDRVSGAMVHRSTTREGLEFTSYFVPGIDSPMCHLDVIWVKGKKGEMVEVKVQHLYMPFGCSNATLLAMGNNSQ